MPHAYDHRTAYWDPSVLGITPDEWARMDAEERQTYLVDSLHRAGDLAHALVKAFSEDLSASERQSILQASKVLQGVARSRS